MIQTLDTHTPKLGARVYLHETAVVIGDVHIGDDAALWPFVVVRGDMHSIRIGACTNIQDGSILHITHAGDHTHPDGFPLEIGNNVTVGHRAMLHGCTIEACCLIGMNATVMDGAVVQSEVILGAGALVPPGKTLNSGYLYVGTPAKATRMLTAKERAFIAYSAENYRKLKDRYLKQ